MADVEKMRTNLAKNEEKLAKKIALLAKYESKKEKLTKEWEKLTKGLSYEDTISFISDKNISLSEGFEKYFSDELTNLYYKICEFYSKESWMNPILSTKKGIKELEDMCQSYKDKIAKEEQKVADRNASISANTISVNGKDVNVIVEFLNKWESECYDYYMRIFDKYEKNANKDYDETVKNSIEYKMVYSSYENIESISKFWVDSEYAEYYPTYEDYRNSGKRYSDPCTKLIRDNLDELKNSWYDRYSIRIIEEWGGSTFRAKKSDFESNMVKYLSNEKNRKYDQLIIDVENIVGKIFDMSHIRVGVKGDLEGYVIGTDGEAELWSKGAGGFNVDTIVNVKHGQRFHFRFYVKRRA